MSFLLSTGLITISMATVAVFFCKATNPRCIASSVSGISIQKAVIKSYYIPSFHTCFVDCKDNPWCRSINYFIATSLCEHNSLKLSDNSTLKAIDKESTYIDNPYSGELKPPPKVSGWKLIARFSNSDTKNWMASSGKWWYDETTPRGNTGSTSVNQDMISEDFWKAKGEELKITRTDDPAHTALLLTTSKCLGGKTFCEKISAYGNFRNGKIWSSEKCLGKCSVVYAGEYTKTAGFSRVKCDSNVLKRNQIGFWCDVGSGAGAVLSIGGAGSSCDRADHGLAVTEENAGKLGPNMGCDFGDNGAKTCQKQSYALNLWVKT